MTELDTAQDTVWSRLRDRLDALADANRRQTDPQAVARRLAERARALRTRQDVSKAAGPKISFLAFCHGSQRYGVPIEDILEVLPLPDYTPAPGTPPFIAGVIHWRGAIISLIDLVKLFQIPDAGLIDEKTCLIVESGGARVGVMTGELEDLCTVSTEHIKTAPDLPHSAPPECVVGVYDENRLIIRIAPLLHDSRLVEWK